MKSICMPELPSQTEELAQYVKYGPDLRFVFLGVKDERVLLRTPELNRYLQERRSKLLSKQEFIHNCGLDRREAEKRWKEATKKMMMFDVFFSDISEEEMEKAPSVLFIPGHHARDATFGARTTGDFVRRANDLGFVAVVPRYPDVYDAGNIGYQLMRFVDIAEASRVQDLVLAGHSLGGITILRALSEMDQENLERIFSKIKRIRLHNTPVGTKGLGGASKYKDLHL